MVNAQTESAVSAVVETDIPARLDRLPWGRFHTLVVVALGITWILDGLEVTLAGAVSGALKQSPQLRFSNADVGIAASAYLAGAVTGAVFFGWLTDRLGRKKLFLITLAVYLVATVATAFTSTFLLFAVCRFFTGAGIAGSTPRSTRRSASSPSPGRCSAPIRGARSSGGRLSAFFRWR
jgi:MFS family permease